MGKVLVSGYAEREVAPDKCTITLTVETKGKTAAKAAAATAEEFEKLISSLSAIGFDPEKMTITGNCTDKPSYRDDGDYSSEKAVRLRIPADVSIANRINDLIATGFENTTIEIRYDISARDKIMKELKKQAVQESRKAAELLAEGTGTKVTGIEAANIDNTQGINLDIADLNTEVTETDDGWSFSQDLCFAAKYTGNQAGTPHADKLKPENICLRTDIRIVWLLE